MKNVAIIILSIAVIALGGFVLYDKVILKEDKTESVQNKNEENTNVKKEINNSYDLLGSDFDYIYIYKDNVIKTYNNSSMDEVFTSEKIDGVVEIYGGYAIILNNNKLSIYDIKLNNTIEIDELSNDYVYRHVYFDKEDDEIVIGIRNLKDELKGIKYYFDSTTKKIVREDNVLIDEYGEA